MATQNTMGGASARLRVHLNYGTNLYPIDKGHTADPYIKFQTSPFMHNDIKSGVVKKNLDPHWNQCLDMRVPLVNNLALEGFVMDVGTITDNAIGYIYIPLTDRRCLVETTYPVGPRPKQHQKLIGDEYFQGSITLTCEWLDGIPSIVTGGGAVGYAGAGAGARSGPMKSKAKGKKNAASKKKGAKKGAGGYGGGYGGGGGGYGGSAKKASKLGRTGGGGGGGYVAKNKAKSKKNKKGSGRSGVGCAMDEEEEEEQQLEEEEVIEEEIAAEEEEEAYEQEVAAEEEEEAYEEAAEEEEEEGEWEYE